MPKYRAQLLQLDERLFLTDGGIETTLIFHDRLELSDFAAFHLLRTPGRRGPAAQVLFARMRQHYARISARLTHLTVMGGCCGTDYRHVERIAEACVPLFA